MKKKTRRRSEKAAGRQPRAGREKAGDTRVGTVQKNNRGFAFISTGGGRANDVYVDREFAGGLLDGDTVEFRVVQRGRRPEARIVRVVARSQTQVVGQIKETRNGKVIVTPRGEWHRLEVNRRDRGQAAEGEWILARIEEYPTDSDPGTVSFAEPLGRELSPAHDTILAASRFGLRTEFAEPVIEQAQELYRLAEAEMGTLDGRRDQRELPYVTIDGEDAKDFDDAVYVQRTRTKDAAYVLHVAIADVSFYVRSGSAIDREAKARSTSVYFPGFCIPMLPEVLSNDLCSLRPRLDRLALTAEIHFDREGNELRAHFYPSLIKTADRLTYNQVHAYMNDDKKAAQIIPEVEVPLRDAYELFKLLRKRREERSVLDFDLPECKIELDRLGRPTALRPAPRYDSHKLIEEFMIAANRSVARALRKAGIPSLFRVHDPPSPESVQELNQILRHLGVSHIVEEVSPQAFAAVLEKVADHPAAATIHTSILRLQKQAHYEPDPRGHFGLNLADYTHFTSPIRRYPDLIVHRSLRQLMFGGKKADKRDDRGAESLQALGTHTSQMERRAMEAERFVVKRKQCWYMEMRIGDSFDGRVSGLTENGVFVEIPEFAADGFIPVESMDGHFEFDERRMCLRRRPGTGVIGLGDPMRVQVSKVSVDENRIWLSLAEDRPSTRRTAPPRR